MAELWPEKRMPIYGIIGILSPFVAHNLVKYQISMKPGLFDNFYHFTYSLQVSLHLSQSAILRKTSVLQKRL